MAEATGAEAQTAAAQTEAEQTVNADAEYWKKEAKQIIAQREAVKAELKAIKDEQEKAKLKALEETNQFKTLYESQAEKLKRLEELESWKKQTDEQADSKIVELSGKLDANAKKEYADFIESLPREKRLDWLTVKLNSPQPKDSPVSGRPSTGTLKDPKAMTFEERSEFIKRDPEGFKKLMQG